MTDTLQERKRDNGFSLIELIVAVLIIGAVSAIAIPVFSGAMSNARDTAIQADLSTFKTLRDAANFTKGGLGEYGGSRRNELLPELDFKPSLDAYDISSTDHNLVYCSEDDSGDPEHWDYWL